MNVLVSLHKGYGMGDAVQMSPVLQHARKYRSNWHIDYRAERGKECVGRGIAHNICTYDDPLPTPNYDAEVQILLYDTVANWEDRPNTRVSNCLHEHFGMSWDPECGGYQVQVRPAVTEAVAAMLGPLTRRPANTNGHSGLVGVHYLGDSAPARKDLTHAQASAVCRAVEQMGRVPLLLDWRNKSPLPDDEYVHSTGRLGRDRESGVFGGDAEVNCAVIAQCEAFVGIDSGPSKCASATDTPSLVVWTGHHPSTFHDPASNTTHLVPYKYAGLLPLVSEGAQRWFERNYSVRWYDCDLVSQVNRWLQEVLQ